ncbi:PIN domain-containing protein [Ramlibacter sp.]|uniref:PIN domain-containing protein n=1 Tax=Ramlibacter sp. TaxID=1917967 RepID=UPI002C4B9B48|nr:PIN domain-containing protein [Ramlibacter sp.]HWI82920.1 PIN domain-containing protein [Ramlibacter sp.]
MLDTNVVLDLLVFGDAAAVPLDEGLTAGRLRWLATAAMRDELARVLGYPQIAARLRTLDLDPGAVLARFDALAELVAPAAPAPVTCSDPDDQCFIDLAVHHGCMLLSKDAAVLALRRRLAALRVHAATALPSASYSPSGT